VAEVRLEGIRKTYRGGVDALQPTDLTFADGEFTCVLGPSGSGKSTILKLIAGIEEASGGRIWFDGDDVTNVTPERRDIAMVFQSYGLYPNMTARDNIAFPLMLRGIARRDRYLQVDEIATMLGLGTQLDRHPRALSGGERQRVALARAIVRKPRVFLLDEPISNLDANLRATTREWLKRLHQQLKATFIYVTHDQDDAEAMGDRVVVMSSGRVQQVDAPGAIYRRPANRFVASFVGRLPMNFVAGALTRDGDRACFEADTVRVDVGPAPEDFSGRPVVLGVRPEGVRVRPWTESSRTHGKLTLTEVIAPDDYATLDVDGRSVRARLVPDSGFRVGDLVDVEIDPSAALLFDPESGARVARPADVDHSVVPDGGVAR
jgi:multiple sugar transport system ATP-binding protein